MSRQKGEVQDFDPKLTADPVDVPDPSQVPNEAIDLDYIGDVDDMKQEVMDRKDSYADGRVLWDPFYFEAAAWDSGRHYYDWNPTRGKLTYMQPEYPRQIRIAINRIIGKRRNIVAKMVAGLPYSDVLPNSSSERDRFGARAAQNWLRHSAFNKNKKKLLRRFAYAQIVFGHAWIKTLWNPYGGIKRQNPVMEGMTEDDGNGGQIPVMENGIQKTQQKMDENQNPMTEDVFSGEIERSIITPLRMYYDPSVEDWDDAHDCVTCEFLPIDLIKAKFPNCEDLSWQDAETDSNNPWEMMFEFIIDRHSGAGKHGLNVYEYWAKSSNDFPEGLHIVIIKDKIRVAEKMPTLNGRRLPFSHAKYIDIGTMRGVGLPELLKPLQYARNKVISQQLENFSKMNNGKIWVQSGTQLSDVITNAVGQIIEYGPPNMQRPQVDVGAPLPTTAYQLVQLFDQDFDNVSGITRIAEGTSLPEVNSGDQVEALAENAQEVHATEIAEFQDAVCDSDSLELQYVQANMQDEILINFQGPGGEYLVEKFKGSEIRDNWNVFLRPSQANNISRSAQRKELEMLLQVVANAQVDPQTKRVIVDKAIDFIKWGEEDAFVDDLERDSIAARQVIQDIKDGKVPNPMNIVQPYFDMDVWRNEIEKSLLTILGGQKEGWTPDALNNLMTLWLSVHQKQIERLQPAPGPATIPPTGKPNGPAPQPAPGPPQGAPQ